MAWQGAIAAAVLDHPVGLIIVYLCSFLLTDTLVLVVTDSCTSNIHFPPGWCGSSALQVCPEVPDLFHVCLIELLLIGSGWEWTHNQQSCLILIPLSTFLFPTLVTFKGHMHPLYQEAYDPPWAKDFLGCLKMIKLPSHPEVFCNLHICILTFKFCVAALLHIQSVNKKENTFVSCKLRFCISIVTVVIFDGWDNNCWLENLSFGCLWLMKYLLRTWWH